MTEPSAPQWRKPVGLMVLAGLLALGIAVTAFDWVRREYHEDQLKVEAQLASIGELKTRQVAQWRQERLADAWTIGQNRAFADLFRKVLDGSGGPEATGLLRNWLEAVWHQGTFDRIRLQDSEGHDILSIPSRLPPASSQVLKGWREAMSTGQPAFQDFYRNGDDQRVYLAIRIPIADPREPGRMLGIAALRVDPTKEFYSFISSWPTATRTAETLLVRREGDEVVYLNELRFQPDTALRFRLPLARQDLPAAMAVMGRTGVVRGRDYRGHEVVADLRPVPGSPWFLVVRMDREEAYEPFQRQLLGSTLLAVLLILFTGVAAAGYWRHKRSRYFQARYAEEQEVAWLRQAMARSLNEICVFNPDSLRLLFANDGAVRNLGYTRGELLGMTMADFKPTHTLDSFKELLRPLGSGERETLVVELSHRRKDGTEYPVETHLQLVDRGDGVRVGLAVINDLTERRRIQDALLASERKFRTLFESLAEGVALHELVLDKVGSPLDYRILDVNPAYQRHTGLDLGSARSRLGSELYALSPPPYLDEYARVAQGGEPYAFETYFPPLERYFRISVISPHAGQFATVFEDITERKTREEDLRQKNAEMEQFTYLVSHDLKSPLVTVKTFLGYLEEDLARGDADRVKKDLHFLHGATEKMGRLLGDLLEVSRVGRVVNPPVLTSFQALVREALDAVAGSTAARGVTVTVDEADLPLLGDRPRLVEVWQNLLENAVKYMGDQPEPRIHVGVEQRGDHPLFFVRDNGVGIDPRFQGKVFGLFEKLDARSEGTGLGLALIKRIIEVHGGTIRLESGGIGQGSCFLFTLPKAIQGTGGAQ